MSTIREPELPAHSAGRLLRPGREPEKVYTADQLRIYGAQCAQWAMERAAEVALNACLVPPDGGSPTEEERLVCEEAARRIRALALEEVKNG